MRKAIVALTGITAAVSLLAISAPSVSASTFEAVTCNKFSIGTVCLVRGWDDTNNVYYFYGEYKNSGASPHTGHIDLYEEGTRILTGVSVTVQPGHAHDSTQCVVLGNVKVRADWVDKNGTHFQSPTKTASAGPLVRSA